MQKNLESGKMQWETDLDEISSYEDDWDMEGSSKPNTIAISNARDFFESASHERFLYLFEKIRQVLKVVVV